MEQTTFGTPNEIPEERVACIAFDNRPTTQILFSTWTKKTRLKFKILLCYQTSPRSKHNLFIYISK